MRTHTPRRFLQLCLLPGLLLSSACSEEKTDPNRFMEMESLDPDAIAKRQANPQAPKILLGRTVKPHKPPCLACLRQNKGKKPICGKVHKGEEIIEQGRPRRYYQFVTKQGEKRLPAEALKFGWPGFVHRQKLDRNFSISFPYPAIEDNEARGSFRTTASLSRPDSVLTPSILYGTNKPLLMNVAITNTSGYEQQVPVWTKPLDADEIPEGIRPVLQGPWGPVPRHEKADDQVAAQATKTLLPGQGCLLFELDLNKHFNITRTSEYQMVAFFEAGSGLPVGRVSHEHYFKIEVRTPTTAK